MAYKQGDLPTLIAHVAVGQSLSAAARAAGMSVSTAQRRLRDPVVQAAIAESQADLVRQVLGRFRDLRNQALDRLSEYLAGGSEPGVVLRAAELVLRHATAADMAWVYERVAQQQAVVAEVQSAMEDLR